MPDLEALDPALRAVRRRHGCDAPAEKAHYAITCPDCRSGVGLDGEPCSSCRGSRIKPLHRCPASYQSPDMSAALRAYGWVGRGFLPARGALEDQHPSFLWFVEVLEAEMGAARAEEEERRRRDGG